MHHHTLTPWRRSVACSAMGLLTMALVGCAADVKERHYFASFKTNERNERDREEHRRDRALHQNKWIAQADRERAPRRRK